MSQTTEGAIITDACARLAANCFHEMLTDIEMNGNFQNNRKNILISQKQLIVLNKNHCPIVYIITFWQTICSKYRYKLINTNKL